LLVSYFEVTIPDPPVIEYLERKHRNPHPRMAKENFTSIPARVDHFAIVTMFVERGVLSGHCYQPDINHRQISFNSFHETYVVDGQNKPPLSDSMVYPTDENSFSGGNLMALYCYQVQHAGDKDPTHKLRSPSAMGFHITLQPNRPRSMDFFGTGYIEDLEAQRISSGCFNRLLKIFGLTLGDGRSDVLSVDDIVTFLELIGSIPLNSIESLKTFVTRFRMGWLYMVTEAPLAEQLNTFFALVRGLVPFRIAAYDGRHRFNLCSYFATGYFHPSNVLVQSRRPFAEYWTNKVNDRGEEVQASYDRCAVFGEQQFLVSLPPDQMKLKDAFGHMRKSGTVTAVTQALVVNTAWDNFFPEFIDYLLGVLPKTGLKRLNYSNFWSQKADEGGLRVIKENMNAVWERFLQWVELSESVRVSFLKGNSQLTWSDIKNASSNPNTKCTTYSLGYVRGQAKPQANVPKNLAILQASMKLLCDDLSNFALLRKFFQATEFEERQTEHHPDDNKVHRSMSYFLHYVVEIAAVVCSKVTERYVVEKALIIHCMSMKNCPSLSADIALEGKGGFPILLESSKVERLKQLVDIISEGGVKDTVMAKSSSKVTQKLKFAVHCILFRDILRTIVRIGFNPTLHHRNDRNHALHLYLK
jgi:hypothetical protein